MDNLAIDNDQLAEQFFHYQFYIKNLPIKETCRYGT